MNKKERFVLLVFLFFGTMVLAQGTKNSGAFANKNNVSIAKIKVIKAEALTYEMDRAYYKNEPFTGESWSYFDKPYTVHEKIQWQNGYRHGAYQEFNEDKVLVSTDSWQNGKQHGRFTYGYPNGRTKSMGSFYEGELHGLVTGYFMNGNIKYEVYYTKGVRNGFSNTYFADGDIEQSAFFVNDKPHGTIYSYYPDSLIRSEVQYKNGIQDGYDYKYHKTGCPGEESYFKNGVVDSVMRVYDDISCNLIEVKAYKNGVLHGEQIRFDFVLDTLSFANYTNGKLDGLYKLWNLKSMHQMDGDIPKSWNIKELETIGMYDNGKEIGYWYYNMSSSKGMRHGNYEDGVMVGKWYFYDIDGYLLFINTYNNEGEVIAQKFYKQKAKNKFKYPSPLASKK